mgnify:CR=1 FL=1
MLTKISVFTVFALLTTISSVSVLPNTFAEHDDIATVYPIAGLEEVMSCDPCFDPAVATITAGGVIKFVNNDQSKHTFTAGTSASWMGDIFDSGLLEPGESYTTPELEVGEYPYFDMIHPWMTGLIVVEEIHTEEAVEEIHTEEAVEEIHTEEAVEETHDDLSTLEETMQETTQETSSSEEGGGCLIATAAFGSEMAPQVQFLRELRDNTVLQTQSGTSFMTGFNQFYYSFSPTVADLERENPAFKETVKLTLTPLLTSLTLLNYVDIDSESEMLGYGIGIIMLNIGMYFVAPVIVIAKIRTRLM